MKPVLRSALLAAGLAVVSPVVAQANAIQIKGLNSTMTLDEALSAVQNRGGMCRHDKEYYSTFKKDDVRHWCWMPSNASEGMPEKANIVLYSQDSGNQTALESIWFSCEITNTCGMYSFEIADALKNAGIISASMRESRWGGGSSNLSFIGDNGTVMVTPATTSFERWPIKIIVPRSLVNNPSFD